MGAGGALLKLFPFPGTKTEALLATWNPGPCQKGHVNTMGPMEERKGGHQEWVLETRESLALLIRGLPDLGPLCLNKT